MQELVRWNSLEKDAKRERCDTLKMEYYFKKQVKDKTRQDKTK